MRIISERQHDLNEQCLRRWNFVDESWALNKMPYKEPTDQTPIHAVSGEDFRLLSRREITIDQVVDIHGNPIQDEPALSTPIHAGSGELIV